MAGRQFLLQIWSVLHISCAYRFDKQQACFCPSFLEAVWLSESVRDVRLSIAVPPGVPRKRAGPSGWQTHPPFVLQVGNFICGWACRVASEKMTLPSEREGGSVATFLDTVTWSSSVADMGSAFVYRNGLLSALPVPGVPSGLCSTGKQ